MCNEWHRGRYRITASREGLPIDVIHAWLGDSYWARGIPLDVVRRSIDGSIPFALYDGEELVGFARVISDCATFAYLADVFVEPAHRGNGLGRWLVDTIVGHDAFRDVRGWYLKTRDAHGLYARAGFVPIPNPEMFMWRAGTRNPTPANTP